MTDPPQSDDALLGAAEVATRLGLSVSRVRVLASQGVLPGELVGGQWVFRTFGLDAEPRSRVPRGRPMSARVAWPLLAELDGRPSPWALHREERARVSRYLRRPMDELAPRLRARAGILRLSVGPSLRERLAEHPVWVDGGQVRGGGVGGRPELLDVIYTPAAELDALLADASALEDPWGGLIVRFVPDGCWPFAGRVRGAAGWPVLAAFDAYDVFGALPSSRLAVAR